MPYASGGQVQVSNVAAAKLTKSGTPTVSVTCTLANTNYAAAAVVPAATNYVSVFCSNACIIAMGEATSAAVGIRVGTGQTMTFPVSLTGSTGDDVVNVQSPVASSVVYLTYLTD